MFNFFKKKSNFGSQKEAEIIRTLFPPMKTEVIEGHTVCVDYSVEANLEAAYQDILDNNVTDQTKNSIKYALERLNKIRNILKHKSFIPGSFEYYLVAGNSIDISYDIEVKKEKQFNEEIGDF